MAQIRIYGLRSQLAPRRTAISDTVHRCAMDALGLPAEKRFHRFVLLDADDFLYPPDRSEQYTIIDISMFEGRSVETKKHFIRLLFARLEQECGMVAHDVEVTITETPRHNWGIRGLPGDELQLSYQIDR